MKRAAEFAKAREETISGLAAPGDIAPGTILAHVDRTPITFATVKHLMVLRNPETPLPDPPSYSSCIAQVKATAKPGALAGQSDAVLRRGCELEYRYSLQSALSAAIHTQWLLDEAREAGVDVSPREVRKEFDLSKSQFRTEAEFARYRKGTQQTIADMLSEIKLGKLTDKLFAKIRKKERPVTGAKVAAYYDSHRQGFAIPEGRDVRIVRTATEAAAQRAKRELQAGKSFASLVKELSEVAQPITAKKGEVRGLLPNLFEEKKLNDAIFGAQLHRLYGPVVIVESHRTIGPEAGSGAYVFEVTRIVPGRQRPLSQVKAAIAAKLTKEEKDRTVLSGVAAFKAKWRARTDCQPGYVVKNCKQYKASERGIVGDPYTL